MKLWKRGKKKGKFFLVSAPISLSIKYSLCGLAQMCPFGQTFLTPILQPIDNLALSDNLDPRTHLSRSRGSPWTLQHTCISYLSLLWDSFSRHPPSSYLSLSQGFVTRKPAPENSSMITWHKNMVISLQKYSAPLFLALFFHGVYSLY